MIRVIINAKPFELNQKTISYREVVELVGFNGDRVLSVTYRTKRVDDTNREGSLYPGSSLVLADGMIFNVADTSAA
jgi:Multiubiquitin